MIHRKGVDLLIRAFDELVRAGHDIELLLVGREAELPQFLAEVSAGTRERILYEGFQPPGALPGFFSRADVFVIPSRHDGWGVVVNQALAAGLPIITSEAVGAGLDLVEHEVNGLRVTAGSLIDLQRAMEKMSRDRELASIWGGASRKRALLLTPEVGAKKWASVFDELNDA
jgi:glycosyltransferase involved in cell wall biosynthesis